MERTESIKSSIKLLDTHSIPKVSRWLAENLQDMQQSCKQITKLIEQWNSTQEIDDSDQKGPQLLTLVEEFSNMYQSLAEQINQIVGESQKASPHLGLQMESQEALQPDINKGSPHATPELKLQSHNTDHHLVGEDLSFSSGDGSFGTSLKEGTGSSSFSSDSESEYFNSAVNSYLETAKQINCLGQQQKKGKPAIEPIHMKLLSEEVDADDITKKSDYENYEELIGRILHYEDEFKVLNLRLRKSEEEVTMLKNALNRSDAAAHDLQVQLGATKTQMEKTDSNLEEANGKILHLENQVLELETYIADSHCKSVMLTKELKLAEEKLERFNEDAATLTTGLDLERQKVVELQERISMYQKDSSDRENEIMRLQSVLFEAEGKHCMEKGQLIMQWELQCKQLEENLRQHEDKMKELHHSLVRDMQDHISNSKVAIEEREAQIDILEKEVDWLSMRHDMVVAERDGLNAQVQAHITELSYRDDHIKELIAGAASALEVAGKLKSRVQELEYEVEMQKVLILDGAEKKREAIRQLCYSLEHYRSGYHELREAFRSYNKRHAILAL